MDKAAKITLLFDTFSDESRNLYESFRNSGIDFTAAVIEDDGFLPEQIVSVYGFFLGYENLDKEKTCKPRYFNEIDIPEYWRIEGNNSNAKVMNHNKEAAHIFYTEPKHHRIVNVVDWLDDSGTVRLCEHYNQYGRIYCRTIFNKKGQKALRKFYSELGKEVILENFVTGDILVSWQGRDWMFRNKTEFVKFFIQCAGLEDTSIYFNSLSYPFFVSQSLSQNGYRDVLFWHEPVGSEIPGNMQIILNNQATRTKTIYVQHKSSYEKLISLGASPDIVKELGYVYSFIRNNQHRRNILICTNSDNIAHINELVQLVGGMHFHIAALTEMSSKLMAVGQYENVSLYPNVKEKVLDGLFEKCDIYLDINYEGEIADAVHRAFLNNQLIVGFEETMHNAYYTADTNVFREADYVDLAEALNIVIQTPQMIDKALQMQRNWAVASGAEDYELLFE